MMSLVTGFQKAFDSSDTMSSACSSVTLVSSAAIRREVKSGSNTTVRPANLATVSKMARESLVIFRLMGARDSGLSSGGPDHQFGFFIVPGSGRGGSLRRVFGRQGVHGVLDLLLSDRTRGIDHQALLELDQSHLEIALIGEFPALVHVILPVLETHAHEPKLVLGVQRIGFEGSLVMNDGGIVILDGLGLFSLVVFLIAFGAARQKEHG